MCFQQAVEMGAQVATVLAMGFAGWAIWQNTKATRMQKKTMESSLFSDFYKTLLSIDEKRPPDNDESIGEWCVSLLGHLEYFAFLVNDGYISVNFADLYSDMIFDYYDNVLIRQAEALDDYYKGTPGTFSELRKLVAKLRG